MIRKALYALILHWVHRDSHQVNPDYTHSHKILQTCR